MKPHSREALTSCDTPVLPPLLSNTNVNQCERQARLAQPATQHLRNPTPGWTSPASEHQYSFLVPNNEKFEAGTVYHTKTSQPSSHSGITAPGCGCRSEAHFYSNQAQLGRFYDRHICPFNAGSQHRNRKKNRQHTKWVNRPSHRPRKPT